VSEKEQNTAKAITTPLPHTHRRTHLTLSGLNRVAAVDDVLTDGGGVVTTDGARGASHRVGLTDHEAASLHDAGGAAPHSGDNRAALQESGQLTEEGALLVLSVVLEVESTEKVGGEYRKGGWVEWVRTAAEKKTSGPLKKQKKEKRNKPEKKQKRQARREDDERTNKHRDHCNTTSAKPTSSASSLLTVTSFMDTRVKPFCWRRFRISNWTPLRTPSGLIAMKVFSSDIVD
jgi:hypothetical protein